RARRERALRRRLAREAAWRSANPGLPAARTEPAAASPVRYRTSNPGLPMASARPAGLPFDFTLPHNWSRPRRTARGETAFVVGGPDGRAAGTAVVAPVSLSQADLGAAPPSPRAKTVGGLPVAALRRTVIDRMVEAGGWVTNDYVRESQGRRVFVVTAQTGAPGAPSKSLTFYFTEVDGRVYSLATTAPVELAEPVAAGSEQFMASLRPAAGRNLATQE
ncbi:MAG TPA: hypothetical protein VG148_13625, partial [Pyrinomonadaceae bacterium]|nr:hypothetical protein [Pyrinomonadaceae bacterium]